LSSNKIILSGMNFFGYHGVSSEERKLGAQFLVDLEIGIDLSTPASTDLISDTVDYSQVFDVVKAIVNGDSHKLVETLTKTIGTEILLVFRLADVVTVRVWKLNPAIGGGLLKSAGVEMSFIRDIN
jgi:dihydroneopterin aldolase